MIKKIYKAIIVGGGISGLACARHLSERGFEDFLLVSMDLGGRIKSSSDGRVNYGAYYVSENYFHIQPFVKLNRKISPNQIYFLINGKLTQFNKIIRTNWYSFLKFSVFAFKFHLKYKKFKIKTEKISQKQAILSDNYFSKLYFESALDFLKRKKLSGLINILDYLTRSNLLVQLKDISAFDLLRGFFLVLYRSYEYQLKYDELVEPFKSKIVLEEVLSIDNKNEKWLVKTNQNEYLTESVIMATPINISKELLKLPVKINNPVEVHITHINAKLKQEYSAGDYLLLNERNELALFKQMDNTYLIYSVTAKPNLKKYFSGFNIIYQQFWKESLFIGRNLVESDLGKNVWLIGDNNLAGLEESYITGIYAANKILGQFYK